MFKKQKINHEKKISNMNLKSTILKRKNIQTINNIKSLTERINEYGKKDISINKINGLIEKNKKIKKKKSPPSNNFNFYVINNIIHRDKDRQELSNEIFNLKLNHHRKNKSSSIINRKIKNVPLSKIQERINTEIGKITQRNNKLIFINEELKVSNINENKKTKNVNNDNSHNISKKISNSNLIINNKICAVKKRRNSNSKNSNFFNNNKNLSSNNFNYINTNYVNNNDKLTIKNIINIISSSNNEKKKSKATTNNLTLGKNITNKIENNYINITNNSKNRQGNSFLVNYIKQKKLLNYVTNNTSNHLKRQSHQRNFSNALRNHLTNFKTDISNKSNTPSISKSKEKFGNNSLMNNPYFPTERSVNNNKYIKKGKISDFGINKSHHKNKVI